LTLSRADFFLLLLMFLLMLPPAEIFILTPRRVNRIVIR
jgi:hypothetical protein